MPGRFSLRSNQQHKLRDLNEQSTKVTNESAFRTREMLKLMHECEDAGVNTLKNLYYQGEKLTRAEDALTATEFELDKAGLRLQNIKRKEKAPCCLLPCHLCFQKDPDKEYQSPPKPLDVDDTMGIDEDENNTPNIETDSSQPSFSIDDGSVRKPGLSTKAAPSDSNYSKVKESDTSRFFPKVIPKAEPSDSNSNYSKVKESDTSRFFPKVIPKAEPSDSNYSKMKESDTSRFFPKVINTPEENEIESNLDQVSNHVSRLKNIATDMSMETGKQNEQIGKMNVQAVRNLTKLDSVTKTTIDLVSNGDGKPSSRTCCCCFL